MAEQKIAASPVGIIIIAAVALLLGAILIQIIASQGATVTTKDIQSSETVAFTPINSSTINTTKVSTLAKAPTSWKAQDSDCYISGFSLTNGSTLGTVTTDYVLTENAGTFTLKNTAWAQSMIGANTTSATYQYCPDDYMPEDWQRSVLNMVPGFFALAILGVALLVVLYIMRQQDLM